MITIAILTSKNGSLIKMLLDFYPGTKLKKAGDPIESGEVNIFNTAKITPRDTSDISDDTVVINIVTYRDSLLDCNAGMELMFYDRTDAFVTAKSVYPNTHHYWEPYALQKFIEATRKARKGNNECNAKQK